MAEFATGNRRTGPCAARFRAPTPPNRALFMPVCQREHDERLLKSRFLTLVPSLIFMFFLENMKIPTRCMADKINRAIAVLSPLTDDGAWDFAAFRPFLDCISGGPASAVRDFINSRQKICRYFRSMFYLDKKS
ncbi:hypothetical protein [Antarcticimicrobium luteum]|uniref:Uncharacterized protein n=1 Tax=Antarcticimicrobium luteum TaxID=2547397 RepID=A0A4R5VBH1_9RHOB|nr:hypothetical protein [Antarcticimicrobium luteum]TDK49628.1 hypothetical protein E1832_08505 [Antarcticimicrobium luteum]